MGLKDLRVEKLDWKFAKKYRKLPKIKNQQFDRKPKITKKIPPEIINEIAGKEAHVNRLENEPTFNFWRFFVNLPEPPGTSRDFLVKKPEHDDSYTEIAENQKIPGPPGTSQNLPEPPGPKITKN